MSRRTGALAGVAIMAALLVASLPARADGPSKHQCVVANEEGQTLRQTGKLREAQTRFAICVDPSCPGPVRDDCNARLRELGQVTPSMTFEFKDASGNDVSGVTMRVDGAPVTDAADGKALDVDPGDHVFRFEAGGRAAVERRLVIHEGERGRTERVVFTAEPSDTATPPASGAPRTPAPIENGGGLGPMRWAAIATGGVGVIGLGVGIGAGLAATSKHSTLVSECPGGVCPPTSKDESDLNGFHSLRTGSTVGYIIGAVGLLGGGALFLFGAPHKTATGSARIVPWVGPGSAGLAGAF